MKDCVSKKITIYCFAVTMMIMVYHWNNFTAWLVWKDGSYTI